MNRPWFFAANTVGIVAAAGFAADQSRLLAASPVIQMLTVTDTTGHNDCASPPSRHRHPGGPTRSTSAEQKNTKRKPLTPSDVIALGDVLRKRSVLGIGL
jgi:hypothetical protein